MISVNGKNLEPDNYALTAVMAAEGVDPGTRGIAVALNDTVVPRGRWADTFLSPGDRVEIVKVLQGG
ncbi:thiamine biosynthesis protein ThiS [Niveispirillum lacus]|uniref:Thiamine biosynthesis protein ThiS n=1 Tax=Niveispirillum lacus TaxID=1981099 RepID=A0A255Z7T4_9PROT|nr:sulfur carrier protein ThiS [Niveispirillum lacus]OYQ36935.1 thiamine biosynthesis protein ThiS [Niveispirillum lacus]